MAARKARSKRNDIIAAALRLFAEKGIKATTIRDIANDAGVTEGALYRHFAGKDELALSLFAECAGELHHSLDQAVNQELDPRRRLTAPARALLVFAQNNPASYEFVMARHHDDIGALPPGQPLPKDVFVRVLTDDIAAGRARQMDVQLGAAMMIGMCLRAVFFWQRGMIDLEYQAMIEEVGTAIERIFCCEQTERKS